MLVNILILDVFRRSVRKMKCLNILPRTSMLSHGYSQRDILLVSPVSHSQYDNSSLPFVKGP